MNEGRAIAAIFLDLKKAFNMNEGRVTTAIFLGLKRLLILFTMKSFFL